MLFDLVKDRFILYALPLFIIVLVSLFLLSAWKNHQKLSKALLAVITVVCLFVILLAFFSIVTVIFFGYNT